MKKKFNFRLQRVLDCRTTEKTDRARTLAIKNTDLRNAETELDEIIVAQDQATRPEQELVSMAEMQLTGKYQEFLRDALVEQRLLVLQAADAVDTARNAYIEKSIETEILSTLKDRRHDQHRDEVRRDTRKALDELTVQRHRFKKSGRTTPQEGE